MLRKIISIIIIVVLPILSQQKSHAQEHSSAAHSLNNKQRKAMHARDSLLRTFNKSDTSINSLLQKLEQYNTSFNQIKNSLASGLDTADISTGMASIARRIAKIKVQAETHKSSTLRYLFVLRDNLDHIQQRLEGWQADLDLVDDKLVQNQTDLIKFSKDTVLLKTVPSDSVLRITFLQQRKAAFKLWTKIDSANRSNLFKVNFLQNKVSINYSNVLDETDQIDAKVARFASRSFNGEFGYLWDIAPEYNDFSAAVKGTVALNGTQLYYFIKNETATHFVSMVFFILFVSWIIYNRQKTKRVSESPELVLNQANYIYRQLFIVLLLVPIAIIPYFYDHPPVIFLETFFIVSLILALILIKKYFHRDIFNVLQQLFYVTLVYTASNLLIQITNLDRFVILFLSVASLLIGYHFSKKVSAAPANYPKNTALVTNIYIGLQFISLLCNISGRFSLAKIIGITATYNLWFLITLYFVVEILTQGLLLQFQARKGTDSLVSWIDYSLLQKKFRRVLNVGAALLWLFFLFQNLNIDDAAADYIRDILSEAHTVGGASFTFGGFVIFIAVIWLSSVTSKIVSYFYDISAQRSSDIDALKKKNRTSALLIRIGVFTVGFFLAVFASNFPLDKITIIISAFGIGIGFGLQNIVNNLVSGLILAFEKPVQIGDIIEVDTRSGTITEIGIRSSKIATSDGAEVIIPNADLISHHVINWTLSNNNRRVELIIGVAYGSDIDKVKNILAKLLTNHEEIMETPPPLVFVHNLNENAVDFRLLFWAANINTWLSLKSSVLSDIYATFAQEGIEIPFPQRDLHLRLTKEQQELLNLKDKEAPTNVKAPTEQAANPVPDINDTELPDAGAGPIAPDQ
jgi:potassium efflux system protein